MVEDRSMNKLIEPQQIQIAIAAIRGATTHYLGIRAATGVKGNAPAAKLSNTGDPRQSLEYAMSAAAAQWPTATQWEIIGAELVDNAPEGLPPGFATMRQPVVLGSFTTGEKQ